MARMLKQLCLNMPKVARQHSPLDNLAAAVFNTRVSDSYVSSSANPERRYGVALDADWLRHHNELVEDFDSYGPNERYMVNKILYSPLPLLHVVGGVGVGKTRFMHFYKSHVLPLLPALLPDGPPSFHVYFDFLRANIPKTKDPRVIDEAFRNAFCDRLASEIYRRQYFTIEREVIEVWEEMLADGGMLGADNNALDFIATQLRIQSAEKRDLEVDYSRALAARRNILARIHEDPYKRTSYLAVLCAFVNRAFYGGGYTHFAIIIDNVDRENAAVQSQVRHILKPFAQTSAVRVVITMRHTTYRQQFDDLLSDPVDVVAYCGPSPLDVVQARLLHFVSNLPAYAQYYHPEALDDVARGCQHIRTVLTTQDSCRNHVSEPLRA